MGNKRPIHIIPRSPNQYLDYKTSKEVRPVIKYKGSFFNFDDMLGTQNSSQMDEIFKRWRLENSDFFFISQSYFGLPRQNIRNNSDMIILITQALGDVECMYKDIASCYMNIDEFKEMCQIAWSEILAIFVLM